MNGALSRLIRGFARQASRGPKSGADTKTKAESLLGAGDDIQKLLSEPGSLTQNGYVQLISTLDSIPEYSKFVHPSLKKLVANLKVAPDPSLRSRLVGNKPEITAFLSRAEAIYNLNRDALFASDKDELAATPVPSSSLSRDMPLSAPKDSVVSLLELPQTNSHILLLGVERHNDIHALFVHGSVALILPQGRRDQRRGAPERGHRTAARHAVLGGPYGRLQGDMEGLPQDPCQRALPGQSESTVPGRGLDFRCGRQGHDRGGLRGLLRL